MTDQITDCADELRDVIPTSDSFHRPIHERALAEIERLRAEIDALKLGYATAMSLIPPSSFRGTREITVALPVSDSASRQPLPGSRPAR